MKYTVTTNINEIDAHEWGSFVDNHPSGTVFQSPEQYELLTEVKKITPVLVAVYNEEKKICGILLGMIIKEVHGMLGFLSTRTVVFGGPIIDPSIGNPGYVLDMLLKKLNKEVKNKCVFIQFRNLTAWDNYKDIFRENGYLFFHRLNFLVNTTSEQLVRQKISKSKLRQIRKGLDAGARIIEPENIEQVREFYNILRWHYKHKVNKPLYDWSFFESYYHMSKKGKIGIMRLIQYQNKIIGGIFSPVFRDKVIYELFICGLDQEYKEAYPSILATWAPIEYAFKNNIKSFDFMGVGVPDREYGVREFKAKFGGDLVDYGRFGRINNRFIYLLSEIGYNILALMKKI